METAHNSPKQDFFIKYACNQMGACGMLRTADAIASIDWRAARPLGSNSREFIRDFLAHGGVEWDLTSFERLS